MRKTRGDAGFTIGQFMLTAALAGVLVAVAIPVSRFAQADSQMRSCQTNQRTIDGAIQSAKDVNPALPTSAGILDPAGSGVWTSYVREYVPNIPTCPAGSGIAGYYSISAGGRVDGDQGGPGFRGTHQFQ